MRKEYKLTEDEEKALYDAIKINPDAVHSFWISVGNNHGFDPNSVGPSVGKSPMCFMADEL